MPGVYDESWIYHPESAPGQNLVLDASESAHLVRVLRIGEGTVCTVTDGRGSVMEAILERADAKRAELRCLELVAKVEPPPRSLAQAILKNRGLEDVVELCTQVPVRRIQPLWTKRVQVPRGRELDHQLDRLRAKAVAGLQQSKQAWLCEIPQPMEWDAWLEMCSGAGESIFVCHPTDKPSGRGVPGWLAVGPEGGFSSEEIELALSKGGQLLTLGESRLRAVAAGFWALGTTSA
jgi:16S rRNA (uracil1498-N3)-methyltransferase